MTTTPLRSLDDRMTELSEYNKECKELVKKWFDGTLTEEDILNNQTNK